MGVVCVYQWPVPEGKGGFEAAEILHKRLETLGATKAGTFSVDCENYQSNFGTAAPPKNVYVIHNGEQPATTFAVLESGLCLSADSLLDVFLMKLNGIYNRKDNLKIQSSGQRYELCDFLIKIGSVTTGGSFKGILVEVEYLPCEIPVSCYELMKEFMHGFMGNCIQSPPTVLTTRMKEPYSPKDTVQQYLEHFHFFKKIQMQGNVSGARW